MPYLLLLFTERFGSDLVSEAVVSCFLLIMKDPKDFDLDEVCVWLNAIGLGSKTDAFRENAVDGTMLVTLTEEDMTELGLSGLQGKKVTRMVASTRDMVSGGSGSSDKVAQLEKENAELKNEIAALRMQLKELQGAKAPAPKPAPAPAPSSHHRPAGAPVVRGAAGGAARGAILGAVAGKFVSFFSRRMSLHLTPMTLFLL